MPTTGGSPNLVLCGFMASGKTTVARLLSARTAMPLLDTDDWIEQREGRTVARLFAELGEPYFRSVERRAVAYAGRAHGTVVSTGGGVVLDPENVTRLISSGVVIYLAADPAELFARLAGDPTRPLAAGFTRPEDLAHKLALRAPYYDALPHRIDTAGRSPEQVAQAALELYEGRGGRY